ncbi:MAG TPA: hypothetical protein VGH43_03265 [Jatrophihabitans sp.]
MFGNKAKREEGVGLLRAEVDRLAALSLPDLATEVMTKVFGTGGPGADGSALTVVSAANVFISEESAWSNDDLTREQLVRVVGEGVQMLEHAGLVGQQIVLVGNEHWALGSKLTRSGESALAQGGVANAVGGMS